jgi:sulfonate transport system substrate-binding protein
MPHFSPSRRRLLIAGSALASAALLGRHVLAAAQSPSDLAGVTLGVGTYKAQAPSFFDDAGVEAPPYRVKYAELAAGNLIVEALAGRSLDIGSMSEIPPIFAIQSHAPIKLIAVVRGDVNNQVFLVPKDSSIGDIASLKGKRVGYVRSTTSHYFLIKALKEQGLSMADITPVALSPQDGFSAFQGGQLDAWVIYGIFIQIAQAKTGARVIKTALGYLSGNYLFAARDDSLDDARKRAAIKDYIGREQRVWEWRQANPERWAQRSAALTGIDAELFMQQFRGESEPYRIVPVDDAAIRSQQEVADLFHAAGVLDSPVDVSPLWLKGVW